jgi:hypothetical protein
MTRAAFFVIFYAFVGTIVAMVGYRILWGGQLSAPSDERTVDGLIQFISIILYTALAFGAGGLTAAWVYPARRSVVAAAFAAAVIAGGLAALMMPWYRGLSIEFPIVVTLSAFLCAALGRLFGLFRAAGMRD